MSASNAPAIAPSALCDELRHAAHDRKEEHARIADERAELAKERASLQALADSIEQARKDLRDETARLQALIDKVPDKNAAAAKAKPAGAK
jgi:peptidoglycan hydrolase CwlO-like protein